MLVPGTRVGPYEVVAPLGAGGMGEVYRARDGRLGRDVAVKILPPSLCFDPERVRRFEQEARAAGALSHPNLLTVFDTGLHDGGPYIAFELLEGATLRRVLDKGGLSLRKALDYGVQIASGLAAAHEKGIVHRDLKPDNLFLTDDGRVKILDFGLAKLQRALEAGAEIGEVTASEITGAGVAVGTVGYMSPEQVQGLPADHRSDIFSLGCVLYEMLAGRRAFKGSSAVETLNAILKEDPPTIAGADPLPPALESIVRRCLEKGAAERFQSARDLAFALQALSGISAAAGRRVRPLWPAIAVLCALLGGFASSMRPRPSRETIRSVRFTIDVEQTGVWGGEHAGSQGSEVPGVLALCPDGDCVAYRGTQAGRGRLYYRRFDALDSTPLPGTDNADGPFFSPDGRWLGFFAEGHLRRISVDGQRLHTVCPVSDGWSGTWASDGTIYFSARQEGPILRVSAEGGTPESVTQLDLGVRERSHRWPVVLAQRNALVFESLDASGRSRILAQSLAGGARKVLLEEGSYPRVAASGHLLYAVGESLRAVPFDPPDLRLLGKPIELFGAFSAHHYFSAKRARAVGQFDIAADGTLALMRTTGVASTDSRLVRVDRSGGESPVSDLIRPFQYPRMSPDGRKVAVTLREGPGPDIWVYDLVRHSLTRLTFGGRSTRAIWTRDGGYLTYDSWRDGSHALFREPADGSGPVERLTVGAHFQWAGAWSPDGRALIFGERLEGAAPPDLWLLHVADGGQATPLIQSPYGEWDGFLSPDGRMLVYTSIESGRLEVYVRRYPDLGGKRQVSNDGGNSPMWARNGNELFYLNGEKMMSVPITSGSQPRVGEPRLLFEAAYEFAGTVPNYDVTPEGLGFIMVRSSQRKPWRQIHVTLNSFELLERLAPHPQ